MEPGGLQMAQDCAYEGDSGFPGFIPGSGRSVGMASARVNSDRSNEKGEAEIPLPPMVDLDQIDAF
jgi:hypothetical protein